LRPPGARHHLERIGDEFGLSGEQVRQIVLNEERRAKRANAHKLAAFARQLRAVRIVR
jgi:hypothetical protein